MTNSLAARFSWPPVFSPAGVLVYEQPRREREVITLLRSQIAIQQDTAQQIRQSGRSAATAIAAELERHVQSLSDELNAHTAEIVGAGVQLAGLVEDLGSQICGSLEEIQWQLAQQNITLDKLLEALKESRNREAQQLVRQGMRHYFNREFKEAKERFLRALDFDTTDYQVLLNLGYVYVQENDAKNAQTYFRRALTLPETLDRQSRTRVLRSIARLRYAEGDFAGAVEAFQETLAGEADREQLLQAAVYHCLAGNSDQAFSLIEELVKDDEFFARVASHPELRGIRERILELLSKMTLERQRKVRSLIEECLELTRGELGVQREERLLDTLGNAERVLREQREVLDAVSYSGLGKVWSALENARRIIQTLSEMPERRKRIPLLENEAQAAEARLEYLRERSAGLKFLRESPGDLWNLGTLFAAYIAPSATAAVVGTADSGIGEGIGAFAIYLFWPLILFASPCTPGASATDQVLWMAWLPPLVVWGGSSVLRGILSVRAEGRSRLATSLPAAEEAARGAREAAVDAELDAELDAATFASVLDRHVISVLPYRG